MLRTGFSLLLEKQQPPSRALTRKNNTLLKLHKPVRPIGSNPTPASVVHFPNLTSLTEKADQSDPFSTKVEESGKVLSEPAKPYHQNKPS
jgi:hypothetical protein